MGECWASEALHIHTISVVEIHITNIFTYNKNELPLYKIKNDHIWQNIQVAQIEDMTRHGHLRWFGNFPGKPSNALVY